MAELLGTVVAGAQAIDYCIQIYDVFRKIYHAAGNQKKYEATSLQLMDTLEQIQACPYLRTPLIIQCTKDVLEKLTDVHTNLSRPRKHEWAYSVVFVFKQKQYDQLFTHLEQKREIMALHIAQINTNALGRITASLSTIEDKIEHYSQQSSQRSEMESLNQIDSALSGESTGFGQGRAPDEWHLWASNVLELSRSCGRDKAYKSLEMPRSCLRSSPRCLPPKMLDDTMQQPVRVEAHSNPSEEIPDAQSESWLRGNIQRTDGPQVLGVDVCAGSTATDTEILRVTSDLRIRNNVHAGNGTQVIGQRVRAGAKARCFSGTFCNNEHRGYGTQIVGLLLE
ncbi:hypothetical protein PG993_005839 [Apiospora rasikravindrae]|uniref:NACHT-NTPase and P-loop NTPases N-terminal domain-containing protein n=1 Tax=Apiospora rasikravindrae TaxID=990691 RepID=A0ABR1T9X9_9PEZI